MKTGFFQASPNNDSSTRLIGFVIIAVALILTQEIIYFGRETILIASVSASTFFLAVTSPTLVWMFNQKKEEIKSQLP